MADGTKFILGNKLGMTQVFNQQEGGVVPVTLIETMPCTITDIRTKERDGYEAIQVGCGNKKKVNKPEKGHLKNLRTFAVLKEFRTDAPTDKKIGDDYMAKLSAWMVTLVGVLWLLPLLGVNTGTWGNWLIGLAFLVMGVGKLMRNYGGKRR